jgi:Arc/MetJ-type ribon-helix-helix transcriptional regulator
MIPEYQEKLNIRLSVQERQKIDSLVKEGKFKTISEIIRQALDQFLQGCA